MKSKRKEGKLREDGASEGGEEAQVELNDDLEGDQQQQSRSSTKRIAAYYGEKTPRGVSLVEAAAPLGSSTLLGNTQNRICKGTLETTREEHSEDDYRQHGGNTVVILTSLRRGEQLFAVAPGAVSFSPNGVTGSIDQFDDDEEQQQDHSILTRDARRASQSLPVPEATAVRESPVVHAIRQNDLESIGASTFKGCSRRTKLMGGLGLLFVVGIIAAVVVTGNQNSTRSSILATLSPSTAPSRTPSASLRPSPSPSNSFKTDLVTLIQSRSPETTSSAVASAVTWMANDTYTISLKNNDDRLVQRFALVHLWFAFGLESSSKPKFDGWMQPTDECTWKGMADHQWVNNPLCDAYGFVIALNLSNSRATGSIPVEIALLSHLKHFVLSENSLTGTIPSQLSSLTSLAALQLGQNNFSGTFPSELWSSLTNLNLLNVRYIPTMSPSTIPSGISALTKLTSLDMAYMQLNGSIPAELGSLTALARLDISGNAGLSGSIPTSIGRLSGLTQMSFDGNHLTGQIPTEVGLMTSLTTIVLNDNSFTGAIPTEIGLLARLSWFRMNNCNLNGTIPTEFGHLSDLTYLEIGWNPLLHGTVPSQIYALPRLEYLAFGSGDVETLMSNSPIATEIGLLTNLKSLNLTGGNFTGTIPTEMASLSRLHLLHLGSNPLTGTIPSDLALLTRLKHLGLDRNNLVGSLPLELSLLTDLIGLDLSLNQGIVGTLMTEIGLLVRLESLMLGWDDFTGTLPTELMSLTSLTSLSLDHNHFSGMLPSDELASLNLNGLQLDTNELTGTIPDSICATATVIAVDCEDIECSCCCSNTTA